MPKVCNFFRSRTKYSPKGLLANLGCFLPLVASLVGDPPDRGRGSVDFRGFFMCGGPPGNPGGVPSPGSPRPGFRNKDAGKFSGEKLSKNIAEDIG